MRIARVLTRLNLGGPARQALASDPLLRARGHEMRLFAGTPEHGEGDLFERARALGLDVVRVPGLSRGFALGGDFRARRFLQRALHEFEPDVVHTHASKAGAIGRSASRKLERVARVHTFHGHVLEGYFAAGVSRGLVALERNFARSTQRVVAVSHATADDLVRLGVVEESKIVVIPPGIDLAPYLQLERGRGTLRERLRAPADAQLVGVVGRLAEVKRPEWAFDVFELLRERHPRLQIVFVGDGELRGMLERRIAALGPAERERVHMLGAVEDMASVYTDLFAVLATSRAEGMPVALIEAGACALPSVATRVGGVPELVVEERTGYLGTTVDELGYGLSRVLADEPAAQAMGQRARMRVAGRHGAEELARRLERLYVSVTTTESAA